MDNYSERLPFTQPFQIMSWIISSAHMSSICAGISAFAVIDCFLANIDLSRTIIYYKKKLKVTESKENKM